jgi:thioredoxin 1
MKILKFYADWCAPCKLLGQKLESANLPIPISEIDVEDNDDLVREYNIRNVPVTILLDDQGNPVKRWAGVFDINELKSLI